MSEKPDKNQPEPKQPPTPAKFATGTQVRLKLGTTVPGFEDIPLAGWSGTIIEVDHASNTPGYLVKWDGHTLAAMHPDYRQRCERDGLELDSMWLDESAIESDTGEEVPVEQSTEIVPRPLSTDDPQPNLAVSSEIKFVKNFSFASQGFFQTDQVPAAPKSFWFTLLTICWVGAFYGVVLGAAVASLDGAAIAGKIVAILLGSGGCLLGAGYGFLFGVVKRIRRGPWLGGVVGGTVAAMVGGMLGIMLIAFLGTVLGGIAGGTLGRIIKRLFHKPLAPIQGVIGGAMMGVAVQAWLYDADTAWTGAWMGGFAGASAGLVLVIGMSLALAVLGKKQG